MTMMGMGSASVDARDLFRFEAPMAPTGIDVDASGTLRCEFRTDDAEVEVRCNGLTPGNTYSLVVGGLIEGHFTTRSDGTGRIRFSKPRTSGSKRLDFDPRSKLVAVNDGANDVLEVVCSGDGEPANLDLRELTSLQPTVFAVGGESKALYRVKDDGERIFKVQISRVPLGEYDLYVGGILRGTITVVSVKGVNRGELKFSTVTDDLDEVLLDFDPRGAVVDVIRDGNVHFTGAMEATFGGINDCQLTELTQLLTSTGLDGDASAEARFRVRDDCDRDFKVELEDLPVGSYDVYVDGALRGQASVTNSLSGTRGQIEFDTEANDPGEILLSFDPRNKLVEVKQGVAVYFSAVFTGAGGGGGGSCDVEETAITLINSGVDGDAKGEARFRQETDCDQDFRVEIENLPADDYTLRVGGVDRGTVTVVDIGGGDFEGQIEFDTDPDEPGEVLLDFDPRGQLVEIVKSGVVYLSRSMP
jgi:hypothetical protein